ncbi:MAG: AAA family ATPase [Alphaproteobacteria bacterium]|jgi:hypothetical protein|nr:AAA family ATPase [Alphaproteobacteria bacterium]
MNMTAIKTIIDNAQEPQVPSVDLLRGDQVKICQIGWLWKGYLAKGKIHILGGVAGTGKTTIALSLAAPITRGGIFPDGSRATAGDVVIWSGEDDPADTLAPRLKAMGADMKHVHFVNGITDAQGKRAFDPAKDIATLEKALEEIVPILVIVDPIVSAVDGDSHKNTETRRALQPIVDLAARSGLAVLGITHFSKGTGGKSPLERVTGSLAFGAVPRVVMVAAKVDDEQGGGRIFCRAKSNIGPDDGGFRYDLAMKDLPEGVQASCVVWGETVEGSARELLAETGATDGEGGSLAAAKEFLEIELADGPVPVKRVKMAAEEAVLAWRTVQRAKDALGIKPQKAGMKEGWTWVLPPKNAKDDEERQQKGLATFGDVGDLRAEQGGWEAVV